MPPLWKPQAHVATSNFSSSDPWLLDSGATYHITTDLRNLSVHNPYTSSDEVMIGNGSGVAITYSGSTTLPTPFHSFTLSNVLCAPCNRPISPEPIQEPKNQNIKNSKNKIRSNVYLHL